MSTTILFFAVLGALVLLIIVLLTLCAIHIGSDNHTIQENLLSTSTKLKQNRRSSIRNDFPIACNDGSYAWFDRRRAISE